MPSLIIDYGGGQTITLPRVQWGSTDTLDYGLVINQSRQGTQNQFKKVGRPELDTRHYAFRTLTLTLINSLRTLIQNNLGRTATITDPDRTYTGVIFSDSIEFATVKDNCAYDVEMDFLAYSDVATDRLLLESGDFLLLEDGTSKLLLETSG